MPDVMTNSTSKQVIESFTHDACLDPVYSWHDRNDRDNEDFVVICVRDRALETFRADVFKGLDLDSPRMEIDKGSIHLKGSVYFFTAVNPSSGQSFDFRVQFTTDTGGNNLVTPHLYKAEQGS